ncbi:unnamed protein product [Bursaphelenchus okinawaensis]|uniref:Protein kinase domain-containing protein n=1 Tax=Bursaphelenchus okinawaensis TaxID=465554 RepID=A0A811LBC4_9BILA|nr:unnamed protein product [Bursaphelenchus okinawaensis]CAG9119882.1 unnamed protein product [Bursaphelenchus okinawaensis]
MSNKEVKVLAVGDINGNFTLLQKKLTLINKKNGPFDLVFCVGEFFGPNEEENQDVVDGKIEFPIALYILGPNCPSTARFYPETGVEFSPNLTFLGRRGILHAASGLTIGYLSGIEGNTSNPFQFIEDDVDDLLLPIRTQSGFLGIDVLVTSVWPHDVAKHSINQPGKENIGSKQVSRLAAALKPRYHFAGMGSHYERSPYRNHRVLVEAAQHTTRFIGLAAVGNPDKEKWIYAFNVKPMRFLSRTELTAQPPNTTEFPYMDVLTEYIQLQREKEVKNNASQFFFDTAHYSDEEEQQEQDQRGWRRRGDNDSGPPQKRKQNITQENCWFCLLNEKAEKHLIVSIGTTAYMATPKGPLNDLHVMVLSVEHVQSLAAASEQLREEVNKYRDAYTIICDQKGMALCIFERNYKTSHLQVQFVPVPKDTAKHLRSTFIEEGSKKGIDFVFMKEEDQVWDLVNEGSPYFYVELPDSTRLFTKSMGGFPIQFPREVLCSPKLLNAPGKVDWRECVLSNENEIDSTQRIKKLFKPFEFNGDTVLDDVAIPDYLVFVFPVGYVRITAYHLLDMSRDASLERSSSEASSFVTDKLPHTNNVIRGQEHAYSVGRKIAPGRYGAVYEVLRRGDGKHFAAKLEISDSHFHGLNMDYNVLRDANRAKLTHFCQLIDRGKIEGHFKFMVMQMLGPNLDKLRQEFQANRFSAPTALRLGLEMLTALEELHSIGVVHRDVKPSNFAVNYETNEWKIYMIDFGLCKQYKSKNGDIKSPRDSVQFRGTQRYASVNAHNGIDQSPRDDLESWFYVIVEFLTGELPWTFYKKRDREAVKLAKENARTTEGAVQLLEYCPRTEFRRIMKYIDGLGYTSSPDYTFLRDLIHLAMKNNDIKPDQIYDWEYEAEDSDNEAGPSYKNNATDNVDSDKSNASDATKSVPNGICEKLDRLVETVNGNVNPA